MEVKILGTQRIRHWRESISKVIKNIIDRKEIYDKKNRTGR